MANLAIKGHATRGKEVIEILEMLGGVNKYEISDAGLDLLYAIRSHDKFIIGVYPTNTFIIFTLEEFLKKFPYKVGDKVIDIKTNRIVEIYKAHWSESNNCTYYDVKRPDNTGCVRSYKFLQPYK
jgi:hypothetical protein